MEVSKRIIQEPDKYDGTKESKLRLSFLFIVYYENMREFVEFSRKLKKEICPLLNDKMEKLQQSELTHYLNSEFKDEYANEVISLNIKLFNVLSSFYAFKEYITYKKEDKIKYKTQRLELSSFFQTLNSKLQLKVVEQKTSKSINLFLKDCRNIVIHKGKTICQFGFLSNNDGDKNVPALIIELSRIWTEDYLNKQGLQKNHCIDAIEVFENIFSYYDTLQKLLDELILNS